ncbi:hypothetical protein E3U43_021824 [Larimichthys crocea]|uniref:Uncharacterized protein n=1 Tax=Larimichthys crocea TaxID=215358 RepID=A0ACD3R7N7_LARCR|nr:hypothetical protein E3U43_021824 [Larimichthys crocea]
MKVAMETRSISSHSVSVISSNESQHPPPPAVRVSLLQMTSWMTGSFSPPTLSGLSAWK